MPQKIISSGELAKDQYITILECISSNSNEDGESWKNTKVKNKGKNSEYE